MSEVTFTLLIKINFEDQKINFQQNLTFSLNTVVLMPSNASSGLIRSAN